MLQAAGEPLRDRMRRVSSDLEEADLVARGRAIGAPAAASGQYTATVVRQAKDVCARLWRRLIDPAYPPFRSDCSLLGVGQLADRRGPSIFVLRIAHLTDSTPRGDRLGRGACHVAERLAICPRTRKSKNAPDDLEKHKSLRGTHLGSSTPWSFRREGSVDPRRSSMPPLLGE